MTRTTLDEARALKVQIAELRQRTLAIREEQYREVRTLMELIGETEQTLRELGALDPSEPASEILTFDERMRATLLQQVSPDDTSAAEFVLIIVGVAMGVGGISAADVIAQAKLLSLPFTDGAIHAGFHRLVKNGSVVRTRDEKGAPYLLTRAGAEEWIEHTRRAEAAMLGLTR